MKRSGAPHPAIFAGICVAFAVAAVFTGLFGWREGPLSWTFAILLSQLWVALLGPAADGFAARAGAGMLWVLVSLLINGCPVYGMLRWISFRGPDRDGFTRR